MYRNRSGRAVHHRNGCPEPHRTALPAGSLRHTRDRSSLGGRGLGKSIDICTLTWRTSRRARQSPCQRRWSARATDGHYCRHARSPSRGSQRPSALPNGLPRCGAYLKKRAWTMLPWILSLPARTGVSRAVMCNPISAASARKRRYRMRCYWSTQ